MRPIRPNLERLVSFYGTHIKVLLIFEKLNENKIRRHYSRNIFFTARSIGRDFRTFSAFGVS
jgi:hypothetical protein